MVKGLGREREKDRRWSPVHSVLHPMVARTGILTSENPWLDFSTVVLKPAVHSNTRNTIYIKVLSFILQRSHLLIFDRDVSSFGECDWLCATLMLLCEWSGFFEATSFWRRGWVFSSSDWRISILPVSGNCFLVVHHDENFQLFYDRTKFNFADVCVASILLMQSAPFSCS